MAGRDRSRRLDLALVELGLAENRARARALVMAGRVFAGERRLDKPGQPVPPELEVTVRPGPRYVGRGGEKLAPTLDRLGVEAEGRECLDVGASTGGFTQVLLERGAARVVALDVGKGQLDWSLRQDPRVEVVEGVNARHLSLDRLPCRPALAVVDVSFISLRLVLPAVVACLAPGADLVALVKPQFEAGRDKVGRKGIVRDPAVHREVLERLLAFVCERDWRARGLLTSPLRGAEGNVEFFLQLKPDEPSADPASLTTMVDRALAAAGREG